MLALTLIQYFICWLGDFEDQKWNSSRFWVEARAFDIRLINELMSQANRDIIDPKQFMY